MPDVPTFTAQVPGPSGRGVRATVQGGPSDLDQVGSELQNIGNEIEAFRDKNDLVNAQLSFEEGLVEINKQFDGDTGFGDIRERRAASVEKLKNKVTENLSDRARAEADPVFRELLLNDEVAFDAQALKSEGEVRVGAFEERKNLLMNSFIYSETDEEKQLAMEKINIGLDSIAPFIPVDRMAKYREGIVSDAKYLRHSARIPGQARAGEKFDPKKYKDIQPGQVVQLQNQFNATLREISAENKAYYNSRIADHNAILMSTGQDDGLGREMEQRGSRDLSADVRANDKINLVVYDAVSRGSAESATGSIADKYAAAREKLSYGVGDDMAAEKQQALNALNTAAAREMADFKADPAAFVAQTSPPLENESPAEYADRTTDLQRTLAGDKYTPVKVLTKGQVSGFKAQMTNALTTGDSQTTVGLLNEIRNFGPRYEHQVLSELKAPGSLHVAMDADEGTASLIASLAATPKATDLDPQYNYNDNVDSIMSTPYLSMLNERISYDTNPSLVEYRNSLVDLGHKWLAAGKDIDDLFSHYNVAESNRGSVIISPGIDEDDFEDNVDKLFEGIDFSPFVSDGNPHKVAILGKLKSDAQIANAPATDERLEPGQVGFYVINPMTNGLLRSYEDGAPLLLTQDRIMGGGVRRTVR
jgi:hypothetical protein